MTFTTIDKPFCPFCKSLKFRLLLSVRPRDLYVCRDCGIVSLWPRDDDKKQVEYYAQQYYEGTHKLNFDEKRIEVYKRDFNRATRGIPLGRLVDFGCGLGHFVALAKRLGWDAMGIELSPKIVEYAREQFSLNIIQGSYEELAGVEGRFSVISLWNVLDQMNKADEAVRVFNTKNSPGGVLVLRVFNLSPRLMLFRIGTFFGIPFLMRNFSLFHDTVFSAATIKRFLQQHGYSTVMVRNSYIAADVKGRRLGRLPLSMLWLVLEAVYILTLGKVCLAPSLLVVARK
jgi:2-polyprenyl-3-methyl-5-hydroxy-6-metoxy-1,4-benzoquinol methylase